MKTSKFKKGFTLIEIIIYSAGLVMVIGVIISLLVQMYGLYNKLTTEPRVDRVGITIVDRVIKDVRSGKSIDLGQSDLNTTTGSLSINSSVDGETVLKIISFDNGRVSYQENAGDSNYLSPDDMSITKLRFTLATSSISEAVRVDLDITYTVEQEERTKSFVGFSILRQSYE